VDAFWKEGWVRLPALISTELAGDLLTRAKKLMGGDADAHEPRPGIDWDWSWFQDYQRPSNDDEGFAATALASAFGRNAARLLGRESSIRLVAEDLAVKMPVDRSSGRGQATAYHQDGLGQPWDRNALNFWIALDEIRPEQGSLQFYSGSHTLGALGHQAPGNDERSQPIDEIWPRLKQCPLSSPTHLQPGDATAHMSFVVHGAPANTGDRPRWAYILSYVPGDALYTGLPCPVTDPLDLEINKPLDHPSFPVVYTPDT
jgi:ectoine hydroxylase-related dioxygenase (phytanoyl-CoA dioxygenase family)